MIVGEMGACGDKAENLQLGASELVCEWIQKSMALISAQKSCYFRIDLGLHRPSGRDTRGGQDSRDQGCMGVCQNTCWYKV